MGLGEGDRGPVSVSQAGSTDTNNVQVLISKYLELVRFAYLLTGGNQHLAEDLVQTVLALFLERDLNEVQNVVAYAKRAILNEYRMYLRSRKRLLFGQRLTEGTETPIPEVNADRVDIHRALRNLSARERAAVLCRYYEDLDDQTTAEILGCSRATVRSLLHRAMPKLKSALEWRGLNSDGGVSDAQR